MAQGKSTANDYFFVRMSIGAHSMAFVYMIKNDIDSVFLYLKQAIEWGEKCPQNSENTDGVPRQNTCAYWLHWKKRSTHQQFVYSL